jgi:succinate dehydrogenase/fumarate reductase flavoprotein subunit
MEKLESQGIIVTTDVLIIGGGPSGLWAANRARELGSDVTVVDKGPQDWGGLASLSGGDFDAVLPGENIDDFVQDLVYYWDGLCEQDFMENIYKHSYERLKDYESLGCQFLTGPDGKLRGIPQRGLPHIKLYPAKVKGTGGQDMTNGLAKKAQKLGVRRLGRTQVTDLLKQGDKVVGAIGFNTLNGQFYVFKAKAVLLATGEGGWKASYLANTACGEGTHIAFRAGAEVKNMEFVRVWNCPTQFAWESQTTLLPLGAKFVNARGESFMDTYCPSMGSKTDQHYNVIGMAIEAREGRGPIYFDVSGMKQDDNRIVKPQTGWQLLNYQKLVALGIDLFKDKTEWMPQLYQTCGGLVADMEGRTKVPGLFVTGNARAIEPGLCIGGIHLCLTAVTGHASGETIAKYAKTQKLPDIDAGQVKDLKDRLFNHPEKSGIPYKKVIRALQEIIFPAEVCILKSEKNLKNGLSQMEQVKTDLIPQMSVPDSHYLMKWIEVQGIAFMTEMYLRASLMRTETRAGHYREDYPDRDDKNWLKWIIINQADNKLNLRTEPVALERYKFKPTRYYSDNFKFPKLK